MATKLQVVVINHKPPKDTSKQQGLIYRSTEKSGPPAVYVLCTKDQSYGQKDRREFEGVIIFKEDSPQDIGWTSRVFHDPSFEEFHGEITLKQ